MSQPITFLFVYGSLRSGFHHPAYAYISRYFVLMGKANTKGVLYDMGDYPAAKPTDNDEHIQGELYQIHQPDEWDWAIAQLDDYEGVQPDEDGGPALYERKLAEIEHDGQIYKAWMYWFAGDVSGKPVVPGGDVLQYLQQKNQ
jgi:gamma-glutamylcyclotransferase (GGCT)/AIG2-like uncharacterized protein YtfP